MMQILQHITSSTYILSQRANGIHHWIVHQDIVNQGQVHCMCCSNSFEPCVLHKQGREKLTWILMLPPEGLERWNHC